jgi:DNA-binding response OmpR family regulator
MYSNKDLLLLISKDRELKKLFRNVLRSKKYQNIELVIQSKFLKNAEHICIKIIFVDITCLNKTSIVKTLSRIREKHVATPIFVITDNKGLSVCPIENLFNYGIKLVLQKPLKGFVLESIFYKNLQGFRDKSFEFTKYHGIILNEKCQYIIYNNCKVFLSQMECHLLSALMEEETPLSCHQIQTILQNNINKNLSVDSVRVSIYRIRRKLKEGIGLDVIKNKYGVGYYIAI